MHAGEGGEGGGQESHTRRGLKTAEGHVAVRVGVGGGMRKG